MQVTHACRCQPNHSHYNVAQVWDLWKGIQPEKQLGQPPEHSHWREAFPLQSLREKVSETRSSARPWVIFVNWCFKWLSTTYIWKSKLENLSFAQAHPQQSEAPLVHLLRKRILSEEEFRFASQNLRQSFSFWNNCYWALTHRNNIIKLI